MRLQLMSRCPDCTVDCTPEYVFEPYGPELMCVQCVKELTELYGDLTHVAFTEEGM